MKDGLDGEGGDNNCVWVGLTREQIKSGKEIVLRIGAEGGSARIFINDDDTLPAPIRVTVVNELKVKAPSAEEIEKMKKVPGGETVWTKDGKREYDPKTKKWTVIENRNAEKRGE